MERTCARAIEVGLAAVAFTEHVDYTAWFASDIGDHPDLMRFATPDLVVHPPKFEAPGYLECLERCRTIFPTLRIISGVELGEPHWHAEAVRKLLDSGRFERVLASLHNLPNGELFSEPHELFLHRDPADVLREYLDETVRMISSCDAFTVLAHIDYPVRYWPVTATPFDPCDFAGAPSRPADARRRREAPRGQHTCPAPQQHRQVVAGGGWARGHVRKRRARAVHA